jgi:hypothetical protein
VCKSIVYLVKGKGKLEGDLCLSKISIEFKVWARNLSSQDQSFVGVFGVGIVRVGSMLSSCNLSQNLGRESSVGSLYPYWWNPTL